MCGSLFAFSTQNFQGPRAGSVNSLEGPGPKTHPCLSGPQGCESPMPLSLGLLTNWGQVPDVGNRDPSPLGEGLLPPPLSSQGQFPLG